MIMLDTHIWIYLVSGKSDKIPEKAKNAISKSQTLLLSAISCWEVALLAKKKRLILTMKTERWINNALNYPKLKVLDLTPGILVKSVLLDEFHPDPADRMIVAVCHLNSIPLITADRKIQQWAGIETIW